MAYARWGVTNWYVFWRATDARTKDEEVLDVWHLNTKNLPSLKYKQVKNFRNDNSQLKEALKKIITEQDKKAKIYDEEDWDELVVYVKKWFDDLDREYGVEK